MTWREFRNRSVPNLITDDNQVHGDVFRPPAHPLLLSAFVGNGVHLIFVSIALIAAAIFGELYTERGSMLSIGIFIYAALAPINGQWLTLLGQEQTWLRVSVGRRGKWSG